MPTIVEKAGCWARALKGAATLRFAERERAAVLFELGSQVRDVSTSKDPDAEKVLARVQQHQGAIAELAPLQGQSLAQDRSDYARVSGLFKGTVVIRGLLDRQILRHRIRLLEGEARTDLVAQGALVVAQRVRFSPNRELEGLVARARALEERCASLDEERLRNLKVIGGRLFPRWVEVIAAEISEVGRAIMKELTSRWIPRISGLVGLGVGWVIAKLFTTSRFAGFLDTFGLYRGSATVISKENYERLNFWGPLIAAAICSYAASRITRVIQRRYGPQDAALAAQVGEDRQSVAATRMSK